MADETLTCDDCGTSTGVRRYVNYTTKIPSLLCGPCCSIRNHPRNRIPEEWAAWLASQKKHSELRVPDAKPAPATPDPGLIAAAAQRLVGEAERIPRAAPTPRSPRWVGRDLEREGWDRAVLVAAVEHGLDEGLLAAKPYHDDWGNKKRALVPGRGAPDPFA